MLNIQTAVSCLPVSVIARTDMHTHVELISYTDMMHCTASIQLELRSNTLVMAYCAVQMDYEG